VAFDRSRSGAPLTRPTASLIPPQVPLTKDGGAWGVAVGRSARWLHPSRGSERAADVTGPLAQRLQRRDRQRPEHGRRRDRRAIKHRDWRAGRARAST